MTAPAPEAKLYSILQRRLAFATGAVALVAIVLGASLRGLPGLWGALIAAGVGILFMLTTAIVTGWAARHSSQLLMAAMLGSWLGKMVLAFVVVLLIRSLTFYDKATLLLTLAAIVIAGLVVDGVTVMREREAYSIDPS